MTLELFPSDTDVTTQALFLNFGAEEQLAALRAMKRVRENGIACEIYPENAKMKKQMEYANRRRIPFVVIIGSDELAAGTANVKNMVSGEQRSVGLDEIANALEA
ncbi:MAG: His/Gly/Thr/Pro-type tRNA ligase C-terminal domain-containing protein [Alistipes onderdonkii]